MNEDRLYEKVSTGKIDRSSADSILQKTKECEFVQDNEAKCHTCGRTMIVYWCRDSREMVQVCLGSGFIPCERGSKF